MHRVGDTEFWLDDSFKTPDGRVHDGSLVLIDTQGLAKGEQLLFPLLMSTSGPTHCVPTVVGKADGLNRIFTATTLLSSVVVINVMRHLNHDAIDKLEVRGDAR